MTSIQTVGPLLLLCHMGCGYTVTFAGRNIIKYLYLCTHRKAIMKHPAQQPTTLNRRRAAPLERESSQQQYARQQARLQRRAQKAAISSPRLGQPAAAKQANLQSQRLRANCSSEARTCSRSTGISQKPLQTRSRQTATSDQATRHRWNSYLGRVAPRRLTGAYSAEPAWTS